MSTRPLLAFVHDAGVSLEAAGIPRDEARLDAELLAREILGWDRSRFIVEQHQPPPETLEPSYRIALGRRAAREPMAYILGHAEFWGLDFEVTPDVLVPRPETELIVESVLDVARGARGPSQVIDIGTGSGCLAVALACEFPAAQLTATDISAAAIEVARRNARRHGVESRIAFRASSFTGQADGCDLIVSNPPYVPEPDRAALQPEVRDHEPAEALFAGPDGLEVIRALLPIAWQALQHGGWLVFEFGFGQADAVRALLRELPGEAGPAWVDVDLRPDLQGIPRVALARKSNG